MAQVPIHLARMAGAPDDETRRRRTARVADTIDVTDSAVTDSTSVTDSLPQPAAVPAPTPAPVPVPVPTRVRPARVRLVWGRRHA